MQKDDYQQLLEKYKAKLKQEFGETPAAQHQVSSQEYTQFKEELYPARYSWYERSCNFAEKLLHLRVSPANAVSMQKNLDLCHLNVSPSGVISLSILIAIIVILIGSLSTFAIPILLGAPPLLFLVISSIIGGLLLIPAFQRIPDFMGNTWRMKASNEMVQSVFYMVTYMRHTSNLERAIEFAADHLDPPLSLDFRKILWDVETQKYSNIRESANAYLDVWKDWNKEFVEAFHLIESSLYEGSEDRRLTLLDKALDVILNGTYENMLHYAHNLQAPMTMLHMLGIILPILGLVILPLIVSFLSNDTSTVTTIASISLLYNIALPIGVYYLGKNILSQRPAGYGASDISEQPGLQTFRNVNIPLGKKLLISVNPLYLSIMVLVVTLFIGFSPLLLHFFNPNFEIQGESGNFKLMEYVCPAGIAQCSAEQKVGPYGIGASILSLVIVAGLGVSVGLYYSLRSKNIVKIRENTRTLEEEFSSALFQLGNRLADGIPAEIAFAKVAKTMEGTTSGDFFNLVEKNITRLGMGLEQSIFDPKVGALTNFPSKVIESSMKVLVESIKKGPRIAAQALLSMSRYIKEIHRVEERLKDLMADVISSMKGQIKFLTPAIAGIVIGITSMISTILTRLSAQLQQFSASGSGSGFGDMLTLFGIGIPTFYFQIAVGIYIVQITYILTFLSNGIENGADKLGERYELGKNLINSTLLYCFLAGTVIVLFSIFASTIMQKTLGG
ncbi:TPA: hypothetical protein HA242_05990 [Candidatus Woesearchaeota archaeon]|nr:hypothetical protein [Candidatus Woesearchaeota archaeon]HIH13247.1 hypothetical protein [Candidatus Woesearchaeota archaeon]